MRILMFVPILLLAGCASVGSGSQQTRGGPAVLERTGDGVYVRLSEDARRDAAVVASDPEAVWPVLLSVYRELGIPIADLDRANWVLGNRGLVANRSLGDEPLSRYLDCGHNLAGPIVSTHRIHMSVLSVLQPLGDASTRIQTQIEAQAISNEGASGHAIRCGSTGELEKRIVAAVEEAIAP